MPSLESILEFEFGPGGLRGLSVFAFGQEGKSPFEDPDIIRPSQISNYYQRLGLESFTDNETSIKHAYRAKALIWHPDRNPEHKEDAEREFKAIDEAYQTLIDPAKREAYNQKLRQEHTSGEDNRKQTPYRNEQRAGRVARSFIDLEEIDKLLSAEQRAKVDYLDFLVDSGQVRLIGFSQVYMQNWQKPCEYCPEGTFSQNAILGYKKDSMELPAKYAHPLLAHGARAMIAASLNDFPSNWGNKFQTAYKVVDLVYQRLNIDLPANEVKQAIPLPPRSM